MTMNERKPYDTVRVHPEKGVQFWNGVLWDRQPGDEVAPYDIVLDYEDTKDEPEGD
jgi:hypothetical protein